MHEKHTIQKLLAQTVFFMMNAWGSELVEDVKSLITALIWKAFISFFMLHNCIKMYGAKNIKNTSLCSKTLFRKSCLFFYNVEIDGRARQAIEDSVVRRMPISCWRTEATDTQSKSVIIVAFPGNNGYKNTPQYYAIRTLRFMLM
jgi:hypothetical protein